MSNNEFVKNGDFLLAKYENEFKIFRIVYNNNIFEIETTDLNDIDYILFYNIVDKLIYYGNVNSFNQYEIFNDSNFSFTCIVGNEFPNNHDEYFFNTDTGVIYKYIDEWRKIYTCLYNFIIINIDTNSYLNINIEINNTVNIFTVDINENIFDGKYHGYYYGEIISENINDILYILYTTSNNNVNIGSILLGFIINGPNKIYKIYKLTYVESVLTLDINVVDDIIFYDSNTSKILYINGDILSNIIGFDINNNNFIGDYGDVLPENHNYDTFLNTTDGLIYYYINGDWKNTFTGIYNFTIRPNIYISNLLEYINIDNEFTLIKLSDDIYNNFNGYYSDNNLQNEEKFTIINKINELKNDYTNNGDFLLTMYNNIFSIYKVSYIIDLNIEKIELNNDILFYNILDDNIYIGKNNGFYLYESFDVNDKTFNGIADIIYPSNPNNDDYFLNIDTGNLYIYIDDWIQIYTCLYNYKFYNVDILLFIYSYIDNLNIIINSIVNYNYEYRGYYTNIILENYEAYNIVKYIYMLKNKDIINNKKFVDIGDYLIAILYDTLYLTNYTVIITNDNLDILPHNNNIFFDTNTSNILYINNNNFEYVGNFNIDNFDFNGVINNIPPSTNNPDYLYYFDNNSSKLYIYYNGWVEFTNNSLNIIL